METNPEIDQDRVEDTIDHFNKFGYVMFPQQVKIYENIGNELSPGVATFEAGCGMGLGTAIMQNLCFEGVVVGTDKSTRNCHFARNLYPWINFYTWDINQPNPHGEVYSQVVCVETIEHVANPKQAIKNLLDVCTSELWISTPNGTGKERPPSNPYHVQEYTPNEILLIIRELGNYRVDILHWDTMSEQEPFTSVDPLIYKVTK